MSMPMPMPVCATVLVLSPPHAAWQADGGESPSGREGGPSVSARDAATNGEGGEQPLTAIVGTLMEKLGIGGSGGSLWDVASVGACGAGGVDGLASGMLPNERPIASPASTLASLASPPGGTTSTTGGTTGGFRCTTGGVASPPAGMRTLGAWSLQDAPNPRLSSL